MPTRPIATSIIKKLTDAGYIAYFAGGWVRDFLMEKPSDDIDIATNASVEVIQNLFPKTIPLGVSFGIVVVIEGGHPFEVATFRKDREYSDGRRPLGFDPATPEEDAQRRDFTINGMFFDPLSHQLYDYVGGQEDIQKKIIRAIGDPHARFREDRLRMMRAVRYSTRFDFAIAKETQDAILAQASTLLPAVAMERIWQEFKKMSRFSHFDKGLILLHELNILPTIFPSLKNLSVEEIKKRVERVEFIPKNIPPIGELLELFPSHSLQQLLELCDYLKLSKEERTFVTFYHHALSFLRKTDKHELMDWAKFYAHPSAQNCIEIYALHLPLPEKVNFLNDHTHRQKQLEGAIVRIRTQNPLVKAEDLLKLGISPGKHLGELLQKAEAISINHQIDNKDEVLRLLMPFS